MSIENIYLIAVTVLFILAISDLVVGVGNDAVNFMNSAVGSRAASLKWILIVSILGVFIGAAFSGGMMEIARKGMFYPEKFLFSEIMIIFLAVMFADVLLLDTFNAAGLPTSTTVSIIFELLGAAVAVAMFKLLAAGQPLSEIAGYINSARALGIVSSILLSVILAFTLGSFIQYLVRLVFSFNWEKTYKYFGALWGGLSISAITFFILIKGAKGATFITPGMYDFIKSNTGLILLYSFLGWTLILQILISVFRVNILKIIVLFGTFSLALAFAGNDLVNFIGVPLAGYDAYKEFISQSVSPDGLYMAALNEGGKTPALFLLLSGLIMSLTLIFSKKAKTVIKTEVNLARQTETSERFSSNGFSRLIVRGAVKTGKFFDKVIPEPVQKAIEKRFIKPKGKKSAFSDKDKPAFDLVRASVNLVVSSALIAIGTSMKLPLSTTYVTFMVAMGTSFSDRAWGRDSAVYRVSGVITVIGGWFFTAFAAFTVSFIFAAILFYGSIYALFIMIAFSLFIIVRTHIAHTRKVKAETEADLEFETVTAKNQIENCNEKIIAVSSGISDLVSNAFDLLYKENRTKLIGQRETLKDLGKQIKQLHKKSLTVVTLLENEYDHVGHFYLQVIDYLREVKDSASTMVHKIWEHVDNNHQQITREQHKVISGTSEKLVVFVREICRMISEKDFGKIGILEKMHDDFVEEIDNINLQQIRQMKKEEISSRNMILITTLLHEEKNLFINLIKLIKAAKKLNT